MTQNLCEHIFHVKFLVDSESGLKIDLGGRISELSLIHFFCHLSHLKLGSNKNSLVLQALDTKFWTIFLPSSFTVSRSTFVLSFTKYLRHWKHSSNPKLLLIESKSLDFIFSRENVRSVVFAIINKDRLRDWKLNSSF